MSVYALENELGVSRLGVTVTRKVGGAVVRNRIKRRLRAIYRGWQESAPPTALDLVLHVRPSAARASYGDLERETLRLLAKVGSG